MIGPVSETGKTMLASLQGAMSRGMPVDQAITYVKSMAQQGVAPLVDLYSLLKQFERLKQPPVQTAQGGNLKEQLNNLEAGIVAGQRSMSPLGIPMGRGLGGLNAGRMENPQFAGGGIVVFDEGGQAKSITPEFYTVTTLPKTYEELAREKMRRAQEISTPEGRAAYLRRQDEEDKALGLGQYKESLKLSEERAKRLREQADLSPEELAALDREAYYAELAGTKEPDFLSALGAAQKNRVERKRASRKESAAAREKADLEAIARAEAREALKAGDIAKYKEEKKKAEDLSDTTVKDFVTAQADREKADRAAKNAQELAKIQKGKGTAEYDLVEKLATTPRFLENGEPNPEYGDLAQRLRDIRAGRRGAGSRIDIKFYQDQFKAAEKALRDATTNHSYSGSAETLAALQKAQAEYNRASQAYQTAALGEDFAPPRAATAPTVGATDFSQMSDEELLAEMQRSGIGF
jgi:hypothetical protein